MTKDVDTPADHGVTNGMVLDIAGHIGLLVISWAFIEQAMSAVFEATAGQAEAAGVRVRRPWGFRDKRKQFERIFNGIPALGDFKPRVEPMLTGLTNLTRLRDCVVHGSISRYDASTGLLTFSKVNPDRAGIHHELSEVRFAMNDLEPAADACRRLATDMQRLAADLIDRFENETAQSLIQ